MLIPAQIPAGVSQTTLNVVDLPEDWPPLSARNALQAIGNAWIQRDAHCSLSVPSAVVPAERSFLINPAHPDFTKIVIGQPEALETDMRLLRNLADYALVKDRLSQKD